MRALFAVSLLFLSFAVARGLLSNIQMRRYDPWFKTTFGFREPKHYDQVQDAFRVERDDATGDITLHTVPSNDNQPQSFFVGRFETPSVGELRDRRLTNEQQRPTSESKTQQCLQSSGLTFRHIVADVGMLHRQYPGAVFQAASQFNCLEMMSPHDTPDQGVTGYKFDHTQGPTCALACPAATLYRNYFVNEYGQGGAHGRQIDLLQDVGQELGNNLPSSNSNKYWNMQNGYALPINNQSMAELSATINAGDVDVHAARDMLRVGVHWSTSVVSEDYASHPHNVTQVYCSALPIGYHNSPSKDWEPFAQLVLDGLYEATLEVAAILAHSRRERVRLFLTKVGGGVFQNEDEWIIKAIQRALELSKNEPLDVDLVHFGDIDPEYQSRLTGILDTPSSGCILI